MTPTRALAMLTGRGSARREKSRKATPKKSMRRSVGFSGWLPETRRICSKNFCWIGSRSLLFFQIQQTVGLKIHVQGSCQRGQRNQCFEPDFIFLQIQKCIGGPVRGNPQLFLSHAFEAVPRGEILLVCRRSGQSSEVDRPGLIREQ
ncbi:MAG: hypothetical protein R3C12_02795 [Planctomycetaceae bacterium]